jgi:hypothetical protein
MENLKQKEKQCENKCLSTHNFTHLYPCNLWDWRTAFDCDSFLDKELNPQGYYWLDDKGLVKFIEQILTQRDQEWLKRIEEIVPPEREGNHPWNKYRQEILNHLKNI